MVYELKDTSKVNGIFADWQETLIYACLQNVMGKIYVTDTEKPESAFAFVGCFGFFAGRPDRELVSHKPDGFVIFVPQNEEWSALIEVCYPSAKKVERFAIKKDTNFDVEKLRKEIDRLPPECKLRQIDAALYDQCLETPVTADFVSAFDSKEQYHYKDFPQFLFMVYQEVFCRWLSKTGNQLGNRPIFDIYRNIREDGYMEIDICFPLK